MLRYNLNNPPTLSFCYNSIFLLVKNFMKEEALLFIRLFYREYEEDICNLINKQYLDGDDNNIGIS